jgi:hypothetical protein
VPKPPCRCRPPPATAIRLAHRVAGRCRRARSSPARTRYPRGMIGRAALVVIVGLATGVVTQLGQSVLPTGWSQAANAISPWLLVAFLAGSWMSKRGAAIAAGIATLLFALVGYYAMTELRYGIGGGTGSLVRWGLGACVGGPVFGAAGQAWRTGSRNTRERSHSVSSRRGHRRRHVPRHHPRDATRGRGLHHRRALVPLVLGRTLQDRAPRTLPWSRPSGLGALGYATLIWLDGVTAGL